MRSVAANSQQGSTLVPVIGLIAILGVVGYFLPDLYLNAQKKTVSNERTIKIQNIAFNLKELGKLLFLYEKVIYKDNPLSTNQNRVQAQVDLWSQTNGSWSSSTNNHMMNSCGGFDASANIVGDMKLNGEPVICTTYIKSPHLSGRMLEDMVLERWARGGPTQVVKTVGGRVSTESSTMAQVLEGKDGHYTTRLNMTHALYQPSDQAFDVVMDKVLREELKSLDAKAEIQIEIFTDSYGFQMPGPERFVKISAVVKFDESGVERQIAESESFVMHTPLAKDFALFVPYPTDETGKPTTKMSRSLNLGGPETQVYGRVFFNGDIDIKLENLPTFHETVIISGRFDPAEPTPQQANLVRQKFRKGVITQFDAHKYLMDGDCGKPGYKKMQNDSNLICHHTIKDYIPRPGGSCLYSKITVGANGTYRRDPLGTGLSLEPECNPKNPPLFIYGGSQHIEVNGDYAYVISPVKTFKVNSRSHIYGVVLGGHIQAANGAQFVALPYMKVGQPGLSSQAILDRLSLDASSIDGGVMVRLMNLPLLEDSLGGLQ